MDTTLTRDDNGRFIGPRDAEGRPTIAYVKWPTDLYLTLNDPALYATAVTEGWLAHEREEDKDICDPKVTGDPFDYVVSGKVSLDRGQRLGLITLDGIAEYTGEVRVEIHNGPASQSEISHFTASDIYPRSDEIIYISIYMGADRLAWLRDEITRRPGDLIFITAKFEPFIELSRIPTHSGTFYIEPDNAIWKEKRCPIIGARIALQTAPAPTVDDDWSGDDVPAIAPTPPAATIGELLSAKIVGYLQWIVVLLGVLILVVLLKGCKL